MCSWEPRPSSSEFCYPILKLTPQISPYPRGAVNNSKLKQRRFWATYVNRKWSFFHFWWQFCPNFGQIISIIVKTLRNANLVASRCFKMKEISLPVDVRCSKTPLLKLPNIQWCFQWWPLTIFLNALWSIFILQFWHNVLVNWSIKLTMTVYISFPFTFIIKWVKQIHWVFFLWCRWIRQRNNTFRLLIISRECHFHLLPVWSTS